MKKLMQLIAILLISLNYAASQSQNVTIIPEPYQLNVIYGTYFYPEKELLVYCQSNEQVKAIVKNELGFLKKDATVLFTDNRDRANFYAKIISDNSLGNEGYCLKIFEQKIELTANTIAGLFYGLKTLKQVKIDNNKNIKFPCLTIKDKPRFSYRGLMLDVSRHFFTANEIKRIIEMASELKLNYFHWHLVDDPGWRIEIKKYPQLTSEGAKQNGDKISEKGFYYTQDEIRDVVEYASERFVEIVPEIEMPGHSMMVLNVMPQLRCPNVKNSNVYCAGNDSVFLFLNDVIDEVAELFPGKYIHIGGDEAKKSAWEECPLCQERIKKNGLQDEQELQSYFINRIEKIINAKQKKILGWSEILQGGLAPNATVMSWLGDAAAVEAANAGHEAILTPKRKCYLDKAQGDFYNEPPSWHQMVTLQRVYDYDYSPHNLSADKLKYIIGGQACLWTERIESFSHLQYMLYPRLFAISECVWTPIYRKNYSAFICRLLPQLKNIEKKNLNFRFPESVFTKQINNTIILNSEIPFAEIEYTLTYNRKVEGPYKYKKPFAPKLPVIINARIKYKGKTYKKNRFVAADFIDQRQIQLIEVSSGKDCGADAIDLGGSEKEYLSGEAYPEWKFWQTDSNKAPHYIIIDLGKKENIRGFAYSPRIDGIEKNEVKIGNILNYEVYVSDTYNNFTDVYFKGELSGKRQQEMITFSPVNCRYVKIVITNGIEGKAAIANLKFFR